MAQAFHRNDRNALSFVSLTQHAGRPKYRRTMNGGGRIHTIVLTSLAPSLTRPILAAFPGADLHLHAVADLEHIAARLQPFALVVGPEVIGDDTAVRLAVLKARHPESTVIAVVAPAPGLHDQAVALAHAQVDMIIEGFEEHPHAVREVFARAGRSSVAQVVGQACGQAAPTLVSVNVIRAVERIRTVLMVESFATMLGCTVKRLRRELHGARLPPAKRLLPSLRALCGSSIVRLGVKDFRALARSLGYQSVRALYNAFHRYYATSPSEVAQLGGLWFAAAQFRAVCAHNAPASREYDSSGLPPGVTAHPGTLH